MRTLFSTLTTLLLLTGCAAAQAACVGDLAGTSVSMPIGTVKTFTALDNTCSAVVPDTLHTVLTYAITPNPAGSITSSWTATGVQLNAVGAGSGTLTFFWQGTQKSVSVVVPNPLSLGGITSP